MPEELAAQFEAHARQIRQSPYVQHCRQLQPLVEGKRVAETLIGPSGCILWFDDGSLLVYHLSGRVMGWSYLVEMPREGALWRLLRKAYPFSLMQRPFERFLDEVGWGGHPDMRAPLAAWMVEGFHLHLDEAWDPNAQISNCHGRVVDGVSCGLDSFDLRFEGGGEFETQVIHLADGRTGWRGYWEQR